MEMHSQRSLYEIHGIKVPWWRQMRRPPIARLAFTQIFIALRRIIRAIKVELTVRHAITELASLDDRMLRDIGITRSEIDGAVRQSRANAARDDSPVLSNDTGQSCLDLPTTISPDLAPDGRPEPRLRRLQSW